MATTLTQFTEDLWHLLLSVKLRRFYNNDAQKRAVERSQEDGGIVQYTPGGLMTGFGIYVCLLTDDSDEIVMSCKTEDMPDHEADGYQNVRGYHPEHLDPARNRMFKISVHAGVLEDPRMVSNLLFSLVLHLCTGADSSATLDRVESPAFYKLYLTMQEMDQYKDYVAGVATAFHKRQQDAEGSEPILQSFEDLQTLASTQVQAVRQQATQAQAAQAQAAQADPHEIVQKEVTTALKRHMQSVYAKNAQNSQRSKNPRAPKRHKTTTDTTGTNGNTTTTAASTKCMRCSRLL